MLVCRIVPPSAATRWRAKKDARRREADGRPGGALRYWIDWTALSRIGGMSPLAL
jgi:hypothetical protein